MTRKIVTLTTDFGEGHYVAQMKGILLSRAPDVTIVDISHNVSPQNIVEGAYLLRTSVRWFQAAHKPIHVCVVDPTVGSSRRPICIETGNEVLIGPDNGVLFPAASVPGINEIFEIAHPGIFGKNISNVFHGRDVFAPATAMLLCGLKPRELGPRLEKVAELELFEAHVNVTNDRVTIVCRPLHIDTFGNIITSLKKEHFDKILDKYKPSGISIVKAGIPIPVSRAESYYETIPGKLMVTDSSSGEVEISRRNGSAAGSLAIGMGDDLIIELALK